MNVRNEADGNKLSNQMEYVRMLGRLFTNNMSHSLVVSDKSDMVIRQKTLEDIQPSHNWKELQKRNVELRPRWRIHSPEPFSAINKGSS